MNDKERRYVLIAIPETDREETCPFYSVCDGIDDCGVLGLKYNTCKVCNAGMTRAEAVERMAREIFKAEICEGSGFNVKPSDFDPKDWNKKWDNLSIDKKRIYYAAAEAALDALLGGK